MSELRRVGIYGVYGAKTRLLQRRLSFEAFGLSFKVAEVYKYLGSRASVTPQISDIQNKILFEVPDRAYDPTPIPVPIGMQPLSEYKTDFSRFGLINPLQDETTFRMHIDDFVVLGRDLIVGDVFNLTFHDDQKLGKSFWEVVDVDLRSAAEKYIAIIYAVPLSTNRTTREIPVDRKDDDIFNTIMADLDEVFAEDVPAESISFDPVAKEPVDYRNPLQGSFLDDPSKEF